MNGVNAMTGEMRGRHRSVARLATAIFSAAMLLWTVNAWGGEPVNRIVSVGMETGTAVPTLLVKTAEPVGYRYTVYDSFDPLRVVIDFPAMGVDGLPEDFPVGSAPLQKVRVSKYELTAGTLARVEVVLSAAADYQVALDGNSFRLIFPQAVASAPAAAGPVANAALPANPGASAPAVINNPPAGAANPAPPVNAAAVTPPASSAELPTATLVKNIALSEGRAIFVANGNVARFEHFVLANPPRLVVDLFGVAPTFKTRVFTASGGMKQVRIGTYAEKLRAVFDAQGSAIPAFAVARHSEGVAVTWGKGAAVNAGDSSAPVASAPVKVASNDPGQPLVSSMPKAVATGRQVIVESLEFNNQDGRSQVLIGLSSPTRIAQPKLDGKLLRLEIPNAVIGRSLRRTIDASAFPSAIATVTPYLFTDNGQQGVRIAVELKDVVPYRLDEAGESVKLVFEDGAFAEPAPPALASKEVPIAAQSATQATAPVTPLPPAAVESVAPAVAKPVYSGQKISLVFDNADVRNILQLIGDVSGLNILASNDVKGEITLRLIDVPWDQALDLVLQTADLGKIQEGNVLRIMPTKKLRDLELSTMQAAAEDTNQGILETRIFEISYASIDDIAKKLTTLKSPRGTITPDPRSKQLIVKDVTRVLDEMAQLKKLIDRPEKQVLIEARIVEVNTNFARDLGVRWGLQYQDPVLDENVDLEQANVGMGGGFVLTPPVAGGIGTTAGAAVGLIFGMLNDRATLNLRLSALETQGEGKIISTPRVTTLNGQKAVISQGTKIPYTVVSDQGADTQFENAELKLEVTPEVNPDGSIILDVKASNSSVGDSVPQAGGGNAVSINERKAETKVIVRDGSTTVIGGIFVEDERDSDTGVPWLKEIPLLGYLFKSESKSSSRKEILIFITPRILEV